MKVPPKPPTLDEALGMIGSGDAERLGRVISVRDPQARTSSGRRYLHWEQLIRHPAPDNLTHEEWWAGLKLARMVGRKEVPLRDKKGRPFFFAMPDVVLQRLHEIDRDASGRLASSDQITNPQTRDRYVQSSLIEEAITSSQLEGAATTREAAKQLLRSGRSPSNQSEQMIVNNFRAIQTIREVKDQPLTPDAVVHLHAIITRKTLDSDSGPFRASGDGIGVYDSQTNTLLHDPPDAAEIRQRLDAMCAFANDGESEPFLHPVIRAILLHFWLAYDHPFVDGNGRTARAIFYWSMLRSEFWLFEFVSISRILRKAPAKYARSFLYTETDENDLTYFLIYQLEVIRRAIDDLQAFLKTKLDQVRKAEDLIRSSELLNHRQLALMSHALRHPGMRYTINSHRVSNGVTHQTARTDLLKLVDLGLLDQSTVGRKFVFKAPPDVSERLKALE